MNRLLMTAWLGSSLRHWGQLVLALLGIALGMALWVGLEMSYQSSTQAAQLTRLALTGLATHRIQAGAQGVPEDLYRWLRIEQGIHPAAPGIEGFVWLDGRAMRVIGVDPFGEADFRPYLLGSKEQVWPLIHTPGGVLLSAATAERLGQLPGMNFSVQPGGQAQKGASLSVVGLIEPADESIRVGLDDVLVMDISWAQELLHRIGRLDVINLRLNQQQAAELQSKLPSGLTLESLEEQSLLGKGLWQSGRNLSKALGLLGLAVGISLIVNNLSFLLVRRRSLVANLKLLGTPKSAIGQLAWMESSLLGFLGSATGIAMGSVFSYGLIKLVASQDGGPLSALQPQMPHAHQVVFWLLGGTATTVLASLPLILEAVSTPALLGRAGGLWEIGAQKDWRRIGLFGLLLSLAGGLWIGMAPLSQKSLGAVLMVVGLAAAGPALGQLAYQVMTRVFASASWRLRLCLGGLAAGAGRLAPSQVALTLTLSLQLCLMVVVGQFEQVLTHWVESVLQADVVVQCLEPSWSRGQASLSADQVRRLSATAGIAEVDTHRATRVKAPWGPASLAAIRFGSKMRQAFVLLPGAVTDPWSDFSTGQGIFVSEPLAHRRNLKVGQPIELSTAKGKRRFPILAIYRDFSSAEGNLALEGEAYARLFEDRSVTSLWMFAAPSTSQPVLAEQLRGGASLSGERTPVVVVEQGALRTTAVNGIHALATVFYAAAWLTLVVAAASVFQASLAQGLERQRYHAVLRSLGLTPNSLVLMMLSEACLSGLASALWALPIGLSLAWGANWMVGEILGWQLQLYWPIFPCLVCLAVGAGAAVLGAAMPAWQASRANLARSLRCD